MKISLLLTVAFFSSLCAAASYAAVPANPAYEMMQQKGAYYEFTYPRLLVGSPKILKIVNSRIEKDLRISKEPCETAEGSDWELSTSNVTVVSNQLFSFSTRAQGYCAMAAHPISQFDGFVFDLSTGQKVTLASQFKTGDTSVVDKLLMDKAQKQASPTPGHGGCTLQDYQDMPTVAADFYMTDSAMTIWTGFPGAQGACNVIITVPLKDLKNDLAPASLAAKLAQ